MQLQLAEAVLQIQEEGLIYLLSLELLMTIISNYSGPAVVFSIVGLAVSAILPIFFRQYYRGLQFMQMAYYFALAMNASAFSASLNTARVGFDLNFLTFCNSGDFVCSNGFALSFGVVLAGVMVLIFIFVTIQKLCGKPIEFEPTFLTLKGFIKWIYVPLLVPATTVLIVQINLSTITLSDLLQPAIVVGVLALFPFFQLIGYKAIQTQNANIWIKWIQFFGYLRLLSTSVLLGCYFYYGSQIYLHCIMISLILYFLITLWKGDYKYPVMERVIFGLGDAAFLTIYYLFKYGPTYITDYDIDFFGLGGILVIDFVLYTIRGARLFMYGANEGRADVNPEVLPDTSSPRIEKKVNKYEHDSGEELQNSRESLDVGKKSLVKKRR